VYACTESSADRWRLLRLQTFSLHIGADLKLPTPDAARHSRFEAAPAAVPQVEAASDPFSGLPFRALAERMGEAMSPVVQAVSAALLPSAALLRRAICQLLLSCCFGAALHKHVCTWNALYCTAGSMSVELWWQRLTNSDVATGAGGRQDEAHAGGGAAGRGGGGVNALHPPLPPLLPLVRFMMNAATSGRDFVRKRMRR
jgi:hypothetical protein